MKKISIIVSFETEDKITYEFKAEGFGEIKNTSDIARPLAKAIIQKEGWYKVIRLTNNHLDSLQVPAMIEHIKSRKDISPKIKGALIKEQRSKSLI